MVLTTQHARDGTLAVQPDAADDISNLHGEWRLHGVQALARRRKAYRPSQHGERWYCKIDMKMFFVGNRKICKREVSAWEDLAVPSIALAKYLSV